MDDDPDDIDLGDGVTVASPSDESGPSDAACVVVTDPDAEVPCDVPTVLYTDAPPEDVEQPERFDAYVSRGDRAALESQVRWLLASADDAGAGRDAERAVEPRNDPEWDRLKRLYEGTTELIAAETVEELYERAIGLTEDILEFDNTSFFRHDGEGFYVVANNDDMAGLGPIPSDMGLLGETHRTKRSFLVDDVRDHPEADPNDPAYRSAVSVPAGDDGVFQAISNEVGAYDETDLTLAELLVSYVSETRSRIESEAALRKSREQIERLHRGATELAAATSLDELFEQTVEITDDILEFDISYVGVVEDGHIVPAAISSDAPADGAKRVSLDDGGIAAEVFLSGTTDITDDVRDHPEARPVKRMYRAVLSVPIGDIGVFQATAFTPAAFDERDAELTELLMAHVVVTAERIRAESRLRDERDRSTALFEHVSDAAVAYDVEGGALTVRDVNRAFQSAFGYDAADVVGSDLLGRIVPPEPDPSPVPEPGADETIPELLVATGGSYRGEVRRRTEGGVREFILNVVPLSPGEERGAGYAIYTDITERKTRESELERQNERLEEFANIVSHDLRNPLSVARGNLDLARETGEETRFDTAERALEQMEQLIDDLLSLARRGQLVDETERVDLPAVAKQAWATTETADAELVICQSVVVDADEDRLVELLANLFRNAVEHGSTGNQTASGDAVEHGSTGSRTPSDDAVEHGGRGVRVEVGGVDGGFYVEDDGPGIEPERRDEVFEPGETTGDDGIGYGLAIVESIAEAHGWTAIVTSGTAGGARFEFRA
ncbi:GAF domain-containing protein [Haloferax sp. KTX1]|uniref:GAF domain-containing sensor histidine kinase n=1 Tax=Haloferax sp. KTX1 TaxID=2600597 RepID=UPI001651D370